MKKSVKNTESATSQAASLRKRAEEMARKKATLSPNKPGAMSPEEVQQTLHELQVHQIELEMQNEEMGRAQVELNAARARYFDLYDLAPVGYCTISAQGMILEANLTAAILLNVARGKMMNQPLTRFILKEDQDVYYLHRKQLLDTGEPQTCELRMVKKDGPVFWVHLAAAATNDKSGATVCRVVMSDITERKKAEESLRESENRLRAQYNGNPIPTFTWQKQGNEFILTDLNDSAKTITGRQGNSFLGRQASKMYKSRQEILGNLQRCFDEKRIIRIESRSKHFMPGKFVVITFVFVPPDLIMVHMEDITERKQTEEYLKKYREHLEELVREHTIKLEASNKELEAFSYSASHDLRAPLRSIDGFSQALLEDCEDKLDIQGKDYLIRIRAATKRMANLIEDLLQLSRLTRTEMNIEKINLTQIARSVIDELQKSQPQRHVEIKIANGLEDTADSRLMRITLDNLLGNAWKFTEKQTETVIEFGCTKEGGKKIYFIRDNGAGFDMAYVDKLFAPFQRLHTEEEFPGTGIGLALVRRIIHRHGGKVWTEGQTGKGATFYFSLHEQ